jgi:chemotaxis methyl-accepting protein methylase
VSAPASAPSGDSVASTEATNADAGVVAEILAVVRDRCGTPVEEYRRATMERRIRNRMISAGARSLPDYLAALREDPDEPPRLLERLLIKVSRVFRNPDAVAVVARALSEREGRHDRIAVWSAGCARGEEPCTLAAVLSRVAGGAPWSILGTDVDAGALAAATPAVYPGEALDGVPELLLRRAFDAPLPDGRRALRADLRARISIARHDLLGGTVPPGAPFDLVSCRNVLIYLEPRARRAVETLLCSSLRPGGLLWLGEAEWPSPEVAHRLAPVNAGARLFRLRETTS